jgi:CcmD family protein
MDLSKELIPILAVALVTWGGVLAYIIRLDRATRALEQRLSEVERRDGKSEPS